MFFLWYILILIQVHVVRRCVRLLYPILDSWFQYLPFTISSHPTQPASQPVYTSCCMLCDDSSCCVAVVSADSSSFTCDFCTVCRRVCVIHTCRDNQSFQWNSPHPVIFSGCVCEGKCTLLILHSHLWNPDHPFFTLLLPSSPWSWHAKACVL